MSKQASVADIFRRALEIRQANPNGDYKSVKSQLVSEFSGSPFPLTAALTIPEYDNIAPEEDWTAGLPVVLRGIQTEDWAEIAHGIIISLEQVENYPKQSGREDDPIDFIEAVDRLLDVLPPGQRGAGLDAVHRARRRVDRATCPRARGASRSR